MEFNYGMILFRPCDVWWVFVIGWCCRHASAWIWWRSMIMLIYVVLCDAFDVLMDFVSMRCSWRKCLKLMLFDDYVDLCSLMLRMWCFDGLFFDEMSMTWWRTFQSFPVRATNGYKLKLIDRLHSWKIAYRTSRMPGDSPIISSDVLLVLQFDSHFRIWRALKSNMISTPMVSLPVSVHRDVLITLDVFPF